MQTNLVCGQPRLANVIYIGLSFVQNTWYARGHIHCSRSHFLSLLRHSEVGKQAKVMCIRKQTQIGEQVAETAINGKKAKRLQSIGVISRQIPFGSTRQNRNILRNDSSAVWEMRKCVDFSDVGVEQISVLQKAMLKATQNITWAATLLGELKLMPMYVVGNGRSKYFWQWDAKKLLTIL